MPENSDSFQFDDFRTFLKSKNYLYQSELFWVSATVSFFELPAVALGPGQKKYKFLEISAGVNNVFNEIYFTQRAVSYPGPGIMTAAPRTFHASVGIKF